MSLTAHLASMPRRNLSEALQTQNVSTATKPLLVATKQIVKIALTLMVVALIIAAITAFNIWMWLPQGRL